MNCSNLNRAILWMCEKKFFHDENKIWQSPQCIKQLNRLGSLVSDLS